VTIVTVHNCYREPGGEDEAWRAECRMLEERGHRVIRFTEDNRRIAGMGRLQLARLTLWNGAAGRALKSLLERERPQVVHFHNTFPLLSASVLHAARHSGAALVQTLHNFRLICSNALLFRAGAPCRKCLGRRLPWPGLRHACYRGSRAATALAAGALLARRLSGTWHDGIDAYIVLSEFARAVFAAAGVPEDKLLVKPNCVYRDPGPGDGRGGHVLFLGRLSEEKGLRTLVEAWRRLRPARRLKIAGQGPLAAWLRERLAEPDIEWLGALPHEQALEALRDASLLAVPSLCYEGSPMVVLEALAAGTPVLASDIGSLPEFVHPGRTGWLAPPGDVEAWSATLRQVLSDAGPLAAMRGPARLEYERRYTAEVSYQSLMRIYRQAVRRG
jgi:glycosyltransferase involved in cell wall biosynthesis